MHTFTTSTLTTENSTITAAYTIDGHDSHPVDINGHTLQEVVDDMLAFWNEAEDTITPFEVTDYTFDNDTAEITIEGKQKAADYEVAVTDTERTYDITITIIATRN